MDFDKLRAAVRESRLVESERELTEYGSDWSTAGLLREQQGRATPPAAVLVAASAADVAAALRWAGENGVAVIPAGGRSGVSGGALSQGGELMIDLRGLDRVLELDEASGVVHVEAGIIGTALEAWLNERGHTLGHFPQSVALSTVGGWIAARSAGQLSSGYGAIEDMLVALTVALPDGTIATSRPAPRTAAGPQLHRLFLGSEGTLGVVVEAWLRVRRGPATRLFAALELDTFAEGLDAVRRIAQAGALPSAIRVYDEADVAIAFRGFEPPPEHPMAILVSEGDEVLAPARMRRAIELATSTGGGGRGAAGSVEGGGGGAGSVERSGPGRLADEALARHWWEHRNDAVETYRRVLSGELLGPEAAVDTIEVAGLWSGIERLYAAVGDALRRHAMMVGCHCSHAYETGCALYFTFLLQSPDREGALRAAWAAALDAALEAGGTITHHHGVGRLKAPWLARELGGFAPCLERVQAAFDPRRIMNPGVLRP
jgi:alkyldihydroxyacetonephosphate synthase